GGVRSTAKEMLPPRSPGPQPLLIRSGGAPNMRQRSSGKERGMRGMWFTGVAVVLAAVGAARPVGAAVTFSDATLGAGIDNGALAQGCAWADYDGDGFPDVYLANNRISIIGAGASN